MEKTSTNSKFLKVIAFLKPVLLKILAIFLSLYGLLILFTPIIFGLIELPLHLRYSLATRVIMICEWYLETKIFFNRWFHEISLIIILLLLLILTISCRKQPLRQNFYFYPLLLLTTCWCLVSPIGITFIDRVRNSNKLSGKILLESAGGPKEVKSQALDYLHGKTENNSIEYNIGKFGIINHPIRSYMRIDHDIVIINFGAFFNMGSRFGFLITEKRPIILGEQIELDNQYFPIWDYGEGIYMFVY